ncbi:MAG TPA: hypothetical protein DDY98_07805 [Ruminococcaceae bacterium]|nr:hypothetical protein [Oscillospiraceae bacterium]
MKEGIGLKRLSVLLISLLFVLVGCGTVKPSNTKINRSFACPITIEQKGRSFSADLTVTEQECTAVFSSPIESKGMVFISRSGQISLLYGNNKEETILSAPKQCFLYWLDGALSQAPSVKSKKENTLTMQGTHDGTLFLLTVDSENGQPLYFEVDSLDLTIKFQPSA